MQFQTRHAIVKRGLLRALKSSTVSEWIESVHDEPLLPHRVNANIVGGSLQPSQQETPPGNARVVRSRADILVKRSFPRSESCYVDLSITSPSANMSPSERTAAAQRFTRPDAAIAKRAKQKCSEYKRVAPQLEVIPFVLDCTGRAGKDAVAFMSSVTGNNNFLSRSVFAHLSALTTYFNAITVLKARNECIDG
jgi:hypothetical protein